VLAHKGQIITTSSILSLSQWTQLWCYLAIVVC